MLEMCIDDESEEDMEELYEQLCDVAENPININDVTNSEEQLKNLQFLSDEQVDDIIEYVVRYGPVRSKAELMMIPSLDINRRQLLSSLIILGESDREKRNKEYYAAILGDSAEQHRFYPSSFRSNADGKGELMAFAKIPFYESKDADKYNGANIKHWLRGNYSLSSHLKVGFVASQDAGEPFFSGKNKWGYDLYSAYLQLKNIRLGHLGQSQTKLKNLVVGRFRIRSAAGLILSTGNTFRSFGVSSFSSLPTTQVSLTPGNSRSETSTMQGIAATFELGKQWEATAFASYRPIDATLTSAEDSTSAIATILRNGYHRTNSELSRKHNAYETSLGAIIGYHTQQINLGLTCVYDHYSLPLQPYEEGSSLSQLYKRFYPAGQNFLNISLNYGYKFGKRIIFHGETATNLSANNKHYTPATINALSFRTSKKLTLSLLQRFYPYRFWTTLGRSLSAGGSNQDESGIYLAGNWNPSANLSLMAYADIAYFAWPKYQTLGSSHSFDNQLQLCWKLDSRQTLNFRYRLRMRQRDADKNAAGYQNGDLIYKNEHRLRATYEWSERGSKPSLVLLTKLDMSYCNYIDSDFGMMVSQDAMYRMKNVDFIASAGYFNTSGYNARIYSYEHSTPYNLSFPSFYGEGLRSYLLADATLLKHDNNQLSLITKLELTQYFSKRDDAKTQSAVSISLRWRM